MSFWFVIALTLTIQEGFSTIAVLVHAQQLHYSAWIITAIWAVATALQITIAYYLGKWIQQKFADSKFEDWIKEWSKKFESFAGKYGQQFVPFFLALIISPALGAFLVSWLDLSFVSVFVLTFLGDACWYVSDWAAALGAEALWVRAKEIAIVVFALVILGVIAFKFLRKKSPAA
jgi:membrane protein YqaA with SNARE-associated domain